MINQDDGDDAVHGNLHAPSASLLAITSQSRTPSLLPYNSSLNLIDLEDTQSLELNMARSSQSKGIRSTNRPNGSLNGSKKHIKSDHLVVVYKHLFNHSHETRSSSTVSSNHSTPVVVKATPTRMKLLPAETLDKICSTQERIHGKAFSKNYFNGSLAISPEGMTGHSDPVDDVVSPGQASYHKYLDLIPKATFEKTSVMELKHTWPLRLQSRVPRYPYVQSRSSILEQQRQLQMQSHRERQQHQIQNHHQMLSSSFSCFSSSSSPLKMSIHAQKPLQVINHSKLTSTMTSHQQGHQSQQHSNGGSVETSSIPPQIMTRAELEKLQWLQCIKGRESFVTSQKTPQTMIQQTPNSNHLILRQSPRLHQNHLQQQHPQPQTLVQAGRHTIIPGMRIKQEPVEQPMLMPLTAATTNASKSNGHLSTKSSTTTNEQQIQLINGRNPRMMIQDPDLLRPFKEMTSPTADFISRQDNKRILIKKFVSKYFSKPAQYYRPGMEISSPMGKRLLESFSLALGLSSVKELRKMIKSYERFSGTNSMTHKQLLATLKGTSKVKIDLISLPSPDKNNCLTSRLLRSQQMINPASNAWGLKSYHIYTFSKQDRMEKMKTMQTGLDWKGRLVAMHCDSFTLDVKKDMICESCNEEVNGDEGHVCGTNAASAATHVIDSKSASSVSSSSSETFTVSPVSSRTATISTTNNRMSVVVPSIKIVEVEDLPLSDVSTPEVASSSKSLKSSLSPSKTPESQGPPPLVSARSTRSRERQKQVISSSTNNSTLQPPQLKASTRAGLG